MNSRKIALIGERNPAIKAHLGIEASLALHQHEGGAPLEHVWIGTAALTPDAVPVLLRDCTAVWCTPGSPYANTAGALRAIQHARIERKAFLGTCGGFQHGLMEFAQNVLHCDAAHAEMTPDAPAPLIIKLSCSLSGATGRVIATSPERFAALLGAAEAIEEFNCNYGVNDALAGLFQDSDLEFVAHDEQGQIRAFRSRSLPFYVGTLFQPERKALTGTLHPIVRAFFAAA